MTTELLTDPSHARADLQMMERTIKANPIEVPQAIIDAMPKVAGTIMLKGNQRTQLAAGRLLLAYMEYNLKLKIAEQPSAQPQTMVNVGVKIENNNSDAGRTLASQIVTRIRAKRISGDNPG